MQFLEDSVLYSIGPCAYFYFDHATIIKLLLLHPLVSFEIKTKHDTFSSAQHSRCLGYWEFFVVPYEFMVVPDDCASVENVIEMLVEIVLNL